MEINSLLTQISHYQELFAPIKKKAHIQSIFNPFLRVDGMEFDQRTC